ncbi:MAG: hypothetical protein ABSF48_19740 [Thermodesulfobacteriota bacterium]|jgi:hypothetical protein
MAKTPEDRPKSFLFRDLDSKILIGTASDRYAGWIGQIYSEGRYEKGITRRSHKVGDKTFNEETLRSLRRIAARLQVKEGFYK